MACRHENLSAVKLLLEHGADVNHVDGDGLTQLQYACIRDREYPINRSIIWKGPIEK